MHHDLFLHHPRVALAVMVVPAIAAGAQMVTSGSHVIAARVPTAASRELAERPHVRNIEYVRDQTLPLDIKGLVLSVDPPARGPVAVEIVRDGFPSVSVPCTVQDSGATLTCATTSLQLEVDNFGGVEISR